MSERPSWRVLTGRAEDHLPTFEAESFDGCACDPPYGLRFMGKAWDHGVPGPDVWREVLRCLKPGAFLLAFGGTRTFHRLACAIEDAGFEIRDCCMFLHGSGFPKSLDISKQVERLDGVGPTRDRALAFTAWMRSTGITSAAINEATASNMASHYLTDKEQPEIATAANFDKLRSLLPVVPQEIEDIIRSREVERSNLMRREVVGTREAKDAVRGDLFAPGSGTYLNKTIEITVPHADAARTWEGYGTALKPAWEPCIVAMKPLAGTFAANAEKYGVAGLNIDGCRIGTDDLSAQWDREWSPNSGALGERYPQEGRERGKAVPLGRWPANVILDEEAAELLDRQTADLAEAWVAPRAVSGKGYRPNALGAESRPAGHEDRSFLRGDSGGASRFFYTSKVRPEERNLGGIDCRHPTLKPIDLCEYLARLILPPKRPDAPRRLLVPFAGAGSEICGALEAGWEDVVGIEMEEQSAEWARARIAALLSTNPAERKGRRDDAGQVLQRGLFE